MATGDKKFKKMPETGGHYRHYKGGRYKVLTMAEHSELDKFKSIFATLEKQKMSNDAKEQLAELKSIVMDDLVIYRSIQYGSTHARPFSMWYDEVDELDPESVGHKTSRFRRIDKSIS